MRTAIKSTNDKRLGKTANIVVERIKIQMSKTIVHYQKRLNLFRYSTQYIRSKTNPQD